MAPENTPHTNFDSPTEDPKVLIDNAKVEDSSPQLPPYAYTVNGGVPPFSNQIPSSYPQPGYPQGSYLPPNYPQPYYLPNTPLPGMPPHGMNMGTINQPAEEPLQPTPYQTEQVRQPAQGQFNQPTTADSRVAQFPPQVNWQNSDTSPQEESESFDYTYITSPARIAIYDNLKSAPRVIEITGAPTHEYIERIASLTYKHAKEEGGIIPYTVIREVSENFIHAQFQEIVVSIMDQGNTIRFADQGPGIAHKDLVQEPGFSSATEPMKRYIRGVGSGLPIVKDYLDTTHGYIEIEDNINKGSVVTISLVASRSIHDEQPELELPDLTDNEQRILQALLPDKSLGITEIHNETGIAVASIHTALSKMEEKQLVEKNNKKRKLTAFGQRVTLSL